MIPLEEFKKALGDDAKELSEKEILERREHQDRMAEVFFSMWLNKLKASKNRV